MTAAGAAPTARPRALPSALHLSARPRESRRSAWLACALRTTVRPALDIATFVGELAVATAGRDVLRSIPVRAAFVAPDVIAGLLPAPAGVSFEPVALPSCAAEWVRATGASRDRAIVYLHGGAFVAGGLGTHRRLCARIAEQSDAALLNVGYRLLPRHRINDAVNDALDAYRHVLESGVPAAQVVLGGDSAGGALALLAARAARSAHLPVPAAIVCLSPWSDLDGPLDDGPRDAYVPPRGLRLIADALIKKGNPLDADVALHRAELGGLPPTLIHCGSSEALLSDAHALARRLHECAVDVTLTVWEDQIHVFHAAGFLPEARRATAEVGIFVQQRTHAQR